MSFRVWFRRWIRSFYRLVMSCIKPYKSDKQRKKERERRRKNKNAPGRPFKKKRKYKRPYHSNYKIRRALCSFLATSLGLLLMFPFGLINFGYKSTKRQRKLNLKRRQSRMAHIPSKKSAKITGNHPSTARTKRVTAKQTEKDKKAAAANSATVAIPKKQEQIEITPAISQHSSPFEKRTVAASPPEPKEPDENTPKSTPKSENDQYIRKRMIIAGSSYCDANILARLHVGSYIRLEAEPDNPHDKDAVKLLFEGEKIGYIAKADRTAFATCLRLKRHIYGIITNIITENHITKYEYETWFESKNE